MDARTPPFDEARLARYLSGRLPGFSGPLAVRAVPGGQSNPTFLLEANGQRWVLRKRPAGVLLPSAHLIDREYRVMEALAKVPFPVPATRLYCGDPEVVGTPFYVMDFVDGRILRNAALPDVPREQRAAHVEAMIDALAALHAVDYAAAGLADYGRPGDYFARQLSRWTRQYRSSQTAELTEMEWLIQWLPAHLPAAQTATLVHGDYRIDNLVFHRDRPAVIALLDWELSTLGNPLADVAYCCLQYHLPPGKLVLSGIDGLDLRAAGIPGETEFVARYCLRTGRAGIEDWNAILAFSLFRVAAIAQGVAARAAAGNASAGDAAQVGALARDLAARGKQIAQRPE